MGGKNNYERELSPLKVYQFILTLSILQTEPDTFANILEPDGTPHHENIPR